jgi:hypothetical protein
MLSLPQFFGLFVERALLAIICTLAVALSVAVAGGAEPTVKESSAAKAADAKAPAEPAAKGSHISLLERAAESLVPKSPFQPSKDAEEKTAKRIASGVTTPSDLPLPLVVRVDKSALQPYTDSERDENFPVDKWVLGAHAVGDSRTVGQVRSELLPDSQEASFDIVFRGRTVSNTASRNDPAIVYSRTFTNFVLRQRIVFDPREGFMMVGEPTVEGDTKLVYDRFASTRQLGRRIITRIAQRQAEKLREPARRIADRDNKQEVRDQFVAEVSKQIKAANEGLGIVNYVNEFLGKDSKLQLHAKSTPEFIYIGLGTEGEKYAPMVEMPAPRGKPAPIEFWVHSSILSAPVAAVIKLLTPDMPLPLLAQTNILGALSAPLAGPATQIDVDLRDGWLVLGLPNAAQPPQPATVESSPATSTALVR